MNEANGYYDPITYQVTQQEEGWTVKAVLDRKLKLSKRMRVRLKTVENGITLNGEACYLSKPVRAGDVVAIRMEQETSDDILPQDIPLHILYEDEQLLVVSKPAGLIVHPTSGHYLNTLANGVVYYWQAKGEKYRFRPIHRLDQDTSGVLAIAKNAYAHQMVSEQLKKGTVDKLYHAIVFGCPDPAEGTVNAPIDRNPENPHERIVIECGAHAITHYSTERVFIDAALVKVRLETGRTHQIRVHMKYIGHSIIGDQFYGIARPNESREERHQWIGRQALHASLLAFDHPISGERLVLEAPLPQDMSELITRLEQLDETER
ncbi:RluA family pseudouridine synthase [Paenibacillus turpanensis]|uniref:RluA family pseudouridine synthase n=1 Tax=Paenibacillus turpanensis TaxID=2689078 RepID=UPI00140DA92E|nr:RluA family pseudouridine synthase [Paenibacillus turpanensis]